MNKLAEMEAFVAVVDTGSMSAAGRRLGIAVSAVSRRIGDLESRLGVRLANRSTRGFSPTQSGLEYYGRCQAILADLNEADAQIMGEEATASGLVRIAMPLSFGLRHAGPLLNAFGAANPGIRLDIDFSDRQADLVEEGFDFAIRIGALEDSSLIARKLFSIRHLVAASPTYWDQFGRPDHPRELAAHQGLVYRMGASPTRWPFRSKDGDNGSVHIMPRFIAKNGDFLVASAEAGLGVSLQPSFLCAQAIADGRLEVVLTNYDWYDMAAYIIYPPGRPLPKRARVLIDMLVSSFASQTPWDTAIKHLC